MSLQGSLRQLGLADVLQTALAGRRGNLILRRGATRAVLHIAADELYLVEPDSIDPDILLEGFVHRGLLAAETVAAERQREEDPLRRVDGLLERNVISAHELDAVLRGSAEDAILDLLTWQDGEFRFEEDAPFPDRGGLVSRVGVDIGGMLLRAAQRLDEHNAIAEALGLEALLFLPDTMASPPVDFEGDPTPTVHTLLDGHRVIDEVAMLCGLTRFAVLRAVFACVRVGAARLPTIEEVATEAQARTEAGQYKVARGLLLQWTSLEPGAIEPLQQLIDLAKLRNSPEEQADALLALGQVLFRQNRPQEAQEVFRSLLALRPGDEVALQALCKAADASGDEDLYRRSAIDLAKAALAADEAERAAEVLEPIVAAADAPLAARVLRARALIRLKSPDALVAEAEAAAAAMGRRARRKEEKEAAAFFRDAIATLAPERSDLLKRFRVLREGEKRPARRVALVVALLAVAASVGFVVLRDTPAKVLEQITQAWEQGRQADALALTSTMQEKWPTTPEADEAFRQRVAHQERQTKPKPKKGALAIKLDSHLDRALASMSKLPHAEGREHLESMLTILGEADAPAALQDRTVAKLAGHFRRELLVIERELQTREDHLASANKRSGAQAPDLDSLRRFIERAQTYRQDEYREEARVTLELINQFMGLHADEQVLSLSRRAEHALERYDRSIKERSDDVAKCRRLLKLSEILTQHERCYTETSSLLVNGDLAGTRACYAALRRQLNDLDLDDELRPLKKEALRRRIPQFLDDREKHLDSIDGMLESARKAVGDEDLETAVRIYTELAEQYYWIRFENVIELPLGIETIPAGAVVTVNDREVGTTPHVLSYRWATQSTVRVSAPGFRSETRIIGTRRNDPVARIKIALTPDRTFTAPVDPTLNLPPVAAGGDLLLAERNGRITRLSGQDGRVLWARKIDSLEGVRALPLVCGHQIFVPFLDGNLSVLDIREGQVDETFHTGRPVGHPAELKDMILVATLDGRVLGYRGRQRAFEAKLGGRPSAGVVVAHGAAWVGFSDGRLGRIDSHGGVSPVALKGREDAVVGITAHPEGLLVSKADGTLHSLDHRGNTLWVASELGDLQAAPARAGQFAAVVDSRGRVLLFDLATGSMKGQVALREQVQGAVLSHRALLIALTKDGRLWIYDPKAGRELCHVDLGGSARFPPAILEGDRLVVSADGESITLIELGRMAK